MSDDSELDHSVTQLIERLKGNDSRAAAEIWQRFFARLLPLARARLRGLNDCGRDEEDLLVSVFDRFFQAASANRFARLNDRDDLWQILLILTERKAIEQRRRVHAKKRGAGQVAVLSDVGDANARQLAETIDLTPGPEFVAALHENLSLVSKGGEKTREVALLRLEGYENREIAEKLGISVASVERKLRVIRSAWGEEWRIDSSCPCLSRRRRENPKVFGDGYDA